MAWHHGGVMEFGLLGPLRVRCGETVLPVPQGNQRALLAMLLLDAGRVVSLDDIAETLWGAAPPPSATATIRNYVRRLRQALGEAGQQRIGFRRGGYLISVAEDELDVSQFGSLLASARAAARVGSWDQAAAQARQALSLWRGEPLADIESDPLVLRERPRLAEMRLQAVETRVEAELHLGSHNEVLPELQRLAADHPLREHLHALLMTALYRSGRPAEALAAYQQARTVLVEELGIEPGSELQKLQQQILAEDPALDLHPQPAMADGEGSLGAVSTNGQTASPVPRQLPAAVADFTGRTGELEQLTQILGQASARTPGTVVISAIGGMAGVGKTALALHWAHQVASRFGDGQLYVNLRGFDPSGTPVTPAEAIRGFLDALGVAAERVPPSQEAQAGLYRSLLADRQMLIVLDNARDEQQVRPLLPASLGSLVLVTSRNQVAGLAAADGARLLSLDILTHDDARQLLAARIGRTRAAAEPDAISEIADLCACLPLALAVAAARAAARPRLPLAALAAELRDAPGRLDALEAGEAAASVHAVFSWSTAQLSPGAARMFWLVGVHPGPEITVAAAASLAGIPLAQARKDLAELARAHLIGEQVPGRYAFHDLLRAYAAGQAAAQDEPARLEALGRVADHYLYSARAAAELTGRSLDMITIGTARPGVTPEHHESYQRATAWFEAEHQVLLAVITLAASTGFNSHAWQIPSYMSDFLERRGHWQEWAQIEEVALAAAARASDTSGQAQALRFLAWACAHLGHQDQALAHCAASLRLCQQSGDRLGEAHAHQFLAGYQLSGVASVSNGGDADALGHAEQALRLYQATGHRAAQVSTLLIVAWCHVGLGEYQQARAFCQQALTLTAELGQVAELAQVWHSLGYAEFQLGNPAEATACYQRALDLTREFGDLALEADILRNLGDTHHAVGQQEQARDAWRQALPILDDLHHPEADRVRAKLAGLRVVGSRAGGEGH